MSPGSHPRVHSEQARDASPYVELDRSAWAGLASSDEVAGQPLTDTEVARLRGLGDQLDLTEVAQRA